MSYFHALLRNNQYIMTNRRFLNYGLITIVFARLLSTMCKIFIIDTILRFTRVDKNPISDHYK